jgi:hypothetical protein
MDAERNAVRSCCAPVFVLLAIVAEVSAVKPAVALAQSPVPSTESPTVHQSNPLTIRNDADAKIRGLLQQMETAIETGHMAAPSSGSAVEMLSLALSLLPLASPDGANLIADFPLALKQRAEAEVASQHPETQVDFLVFANLVSSVLASRQHANQTDAPESAAAPPPAAAPSEGDHTGSIVRLTPRQETIPETQPAANPALPGIPGTDKTGPSATIATDAARAAQPEPSNTTPLPAVGTVATGVGGQPTPSPSVRAAPWQAVPSAGDTQALPKTAETAKPATAISPALSGVNSDQRPHPLPTNTVQFSQSAVTETPLVRKQPQGPSQDVPTPLTGASSNEGVPPVQGSKIAGTTAELRVPHATPPVPRQPGQDQAASGSRDRTAKAAADTTPDRTSRVVRLALARPPGNLQTAPAPKQPSEQHPRLPPELVRSLVQRGDGMISLGDISGARRLYALAADEGDGEAAMKLGDTYNPEFLSDHGVQGLQPDLNTAEIWYRKAMKLGDAEAAKHLTTLTSLR